MTHDPARGGPSRLRQPWLSVARVVWIILTALNIGPVLWLLPGYYRSLQSFDPAAFQMVWTRAELVSALEMSGLSPVLLINLYLITSIIILIVFWLIAFLLFWVRSDEWLGLMTGYMLVGVAIGFAGVNWELPDLPPLMARIYDLLLTLVWPSFFTLLYIYPNGRFVPRWSWPLALFVYMFFMLGIVFWADEAPSELEVVIFLVFATGVGSQIYRYLRVSTPLERQQAKLMLYAIAVWFALWMAEVVVALLYPAVAEPGPEGVLFTLIGNRLTYLLLLMIPISIAVALIRYRLWDVDVVIRRTLIYSTITVVLALVYFGGVALMQSAFVALTGQESPLAVVASTLAIAALFTPVRRRVQNVVDRRFYRRKYDAEKTVDAFARAVRDEVDVDRLRGTLLGVVEETMHPEHVSLWLRSGRTGG